MVPIATENEFDDLMALSFDALLEVAGELRELVISDGNKGQVTINKRVIWATDALSRPTITRIGGVFLGDVLLSMWETDLPRRPLAGEFLYSPREKQWEILGCFHSNGVYYLTLHAIRAS